MKNIRIGKDITVRWPILTNTKPLTLAGRDLTLFIKSPDSSGAPTLFECEANVAVFHIRGVSQLHVGAYSFTLFENYGKIGQTAVDYCEAFRLVSSTCKEDLVAPAGNLTVETVNLESSILELGVQGDKGLSAYEVEVKNGFVGTEAEWLKSLHADADKVAADLLLETKTRVAADQSFAAKQAEEERARVAADQALTTEVGKKATPQQITDAVAAEIAARVAADQELAAAAERIMNAKDAATLTAAKEFATAADTTTLRDAKAFTTSEIAKIPTPDVSGQIATHNSATTSHADIRKLIPTKTSQLTNDAKFLTSEVDPTVPAWAKNPTKPVYTASEVGAEPVQVVETIAAATATLNVVGGHTYLCGVMTSLTLATVENAPREAVIRFASGAAATTLALPATLKVVGYAKPAANQSYEISIRQGAAVIVNF